MSVQRPSPERHNLSNLRGSSEGQIDGSREFGFTERFSDHDRVRMTCPDTSGVAADEHMRDRPRTQDFLDGGNTASAAQAGIDDHQIRLVAGRGAHRLGLCGRRRANIVAHACEQFGEQHGDQGVILDDEHAERFHQLIDAHP